MSAAPIALDVQVRRADLRDVRVIESPVPGATGLEPGRAVLRIERFALTANNVTYGACGDVPHLEYWRFFPAPEGWGRVPVWGFATAVASSHPGVALGDRFYGFLPMSTHLVVEPAAAGAQGFVDGAAHRHGLSPVYNTYVRVREQPGQDAVARAASEAEAMLLRPLFTTAFLIDDFLADEGFFSARRVVLASASSKTAYATAFLLARRRGTPQAVEVVGLTSPANVGFVERLGCYDRVLAYADAERLEADVPTVYVDMSGDAGLRERVHRRLGDALRHDCAVGLTRWEEGVGRRRPDGAAPAPLPGPKPTMFFAPARWKKREADWGAAGFMARQSEARDAFSAKLRGDGGWMTVVEGRGPADVVRVWRELVDGRGRPEQGHVLAPDPT
ncbi:MAG: DUF2855 family protein [Burkholderiaceae bacterium]|nr:DUF2855 family protein [Burkholderiales bacterium]MCZ8338904.1 DUF2855 family protein [Burkholderiaceae bacterium]